MRLIERYGHYTSSENAILQFTTSYFRINMLSFQTQGINRDKLYHFVDLSFLQKEIQHKNCRSALLESDAILYS